MLHKAIVHATLIDWATRREGALTNALIDTVSVLNGGKMPIEDRLQAVELAAERAAHSGLRPAALTDEITALDALSRYGLLSEDQRARLRHAEREMHKSVEV